MRRALPVLSSTESVVCARLRATLALGSCVQRYLLASTGERTTGSWSRNGQPRGAEQYVSCRKCVEGKQRMREGAR